MQGIKEFRCLEYRCYRGGQDIMIISSLRIETADDSIDNQVPV